MSTKLSIFRVRATHLILAFQAAFVEEPQKPFRALFLVDPGQIMPDGATSEHGDCFQASVTSIAYAKNKDCFDIAGILFKPQNKPTETDAEPAEIRYHYTGYIDTTGIGNSYIAIEE